MTSYRTREDWSAVSRFWPAPLFAGTIILLFLLFPQAPPPRSGSAPRVVLHFAIADLDGDHKPDLALVESQSQRSSGNAYLIRLRFGSGAESMIGVDAPPGGLQIAARDVNGDDLLDLVVSSEYGSRVVGVFLNDGHGRFSPADPEAFSWISQESNLFLRQQPLPELDQVLLAQSRSSFEGEVIPSKEIFLAHSEFKLEAAQSGLRKSQVAGSRLGRAPPSPVSVG